MKTSDAVELITEIAKFDGREVTRAAAEAWASALHDIPLADALAVLPSYYRTASRDVKTWIMPGDIVYAARDLHRIRAREIGRAAGDLAIAGRTEDDDDVRDAGGLEMVRMRAAAAARAAWTEDNPMPGADVEIAEQKHLERTGRYEDHHWGRQLKVPEATAGVSEWARAVAEDMAARPHVESATR